MSSSEVRPIDSPWTGRRRLLTALDGGVPDRVPINTYEIAGRDSRDWYARQPAWAGLMRRIRERTDCITNWNPRPAGDDFLAEGFLGGEIAPRTEVSTDSASGRTRTVRTLDTPRGKIRSVTESHPDVHTTWTVEPWCKSVEDVDRALSVDWEPLRFDASDLPRVEEELGGEGLVMASLADPAYLVADLMSFEDYTLWAHQETEHFARAVDIVAERVLENLDRQLDACVVDVYRICGPEYMTPPYLPPEFFRRFMLPPVRAMTERIRARGARVRIHCHGRIGRVLDMILETGCDAIDPCEPPPDGDLELDEVKRRCAAAGVSVWGNLELRLLEGGTPAEVRDEVRRVMDQAKEGGGFVLMPTASPIDRDLAPRTAENYRAFIEAGHELGGY